MHPQRFAVGADGNVHAAIQQRLVQGRAASDEEIDLYRVTLSMTLALDLSRTATRKASIGT